MTSILLCGDLHLSDRSPVSCTPQYNDQLFTMLDEVVDLSNSVDAVVFSGDVFHAKAPHRTSHRTVQRMIDVVQAFPCPVLLVPGNHDLQQDRLASIHETQPFGTLLRAGARLLVGWDREFPIYGVPWLQDWSDHGEHFVEWLTEGDSRYGDLQNCLLVTHCFAGETRFITYDGVKRFDEVSGTDQWVLSHDIDLSHYGNRSRADGKWEKARIRSYGVQGLRTVTLIRNKVRRVVRVTPDHRWFASRSYARQGRVREYRTDELEPGMILASLTTRHNVRNSVVSPFGVAHGFVFGDGSLQVVRDVPRCSRVTLWGEKDLQLEGYFNGSKTVDVETPNGVKGRSIRNLPCFFKNFPALDESVSYLYGWLAGYFAADGHVTDKGVAELYSVDFDNLEFVQRLCLRLGITTFGVKRKNTKSGFNGSDTLYAITFSRRSLRSEFFLIDEHRRRFNVVGGSDARERIGWRVESVIDHGESEEVFCASVSETGTFTLEDYIWTHNCPIYPPGRENPFECVPASHIAGAMQVGYCYYGHVHDHHGSYTVDGVTFCNQGALSRGSLQEEDLTRRPAVTYWHSDRSGLAAFERVELTSAPPADQVFRVAEAAERVDHRERLEDFLAAVGRAEVAQTSVEAVLAHLGTLGLAAPERALAEDVLRSAEAGELR